MRGIAKVLLLGLGVLLLAGGGFALANGLAPDAGPIASARSALMDAALERSMSGGPADLHDTLGSALDSPLVQYGATLLGVILLVAGLLPGRTPVPPAAEGDDEDAPVEHVVPLEKKAVKKAIKQAAALAKAGRHLEAAELCFQNASLDDAAKYYVEAGELIRAAEIRHDQKRFIDSAELYMQAGSYDSAGAIFAQEEEWERAADAYVEAGNKSVAAEMYEKAEQWRKAGECYEASDFQRHAAKAWVRCAEWARGAACLEAVIIEDMSGAGHGDTKKQNETRKLVRMAGDLYTRAGEDEKAQRILERGECWAQAAEIAQRIGNLEEAADLFQRAHDAPSAADVLESMGRTEDAARVRAEYHRDRGEEDLAAQAFEAANDHMAAGDLYRLTEKFERAAACYERQNEFAQAAEMYSSANDRPKAAEAFEKAGLHVEAAEAWAMAGDKRREAECLAQAGMGLRAGLLFQEAGDEEEAIKSLQSVRSDEDGFAQASAVLGEIFRKRGKHSLALTKLSEAVAGAEVGPDTVQAFYGLAAVHEAMESYQEALEAYEKVQSFDFHYEDVEARVAHCKSELNGQSARAEISAPLMNSQAEGRYRITGKLGRGGMGVVYKAQDSVLDRTVALKVLPETLKENPQSLKNFLREAKSAAQLNHPNIVTVFDAGEQDGVYYIAMEYVDGSTLKEIVRARGKISTGGIIHVLAQMCEALAFAHEKKIVHRDIKTANTMWTRDRKAKIMDFGLAKVIEEVRNHTTVVSGTPYYMSPEQTLGKNVDHRTDIYSLGVTIFELATGTLPFREGNLPYHHVHTPPPDPTEFCADISPLVRNIILRCLQKDPDDRYASTREILEELKGALKA